MNSITLIVGRKHRGKTTLMKKLLEDLDAIIIDPRHQIEDHRCVYIQDEKDFDLFCLNHANDTNLNLAIDEVSYFCNPHKIPPNFSRLLKSSASQNVNLLMTTWRIQDVHSEILTQLDYLISFQLIGVRALQTLADYTSPQFAAEVETLPLYQYRVWNF